MFDLNFILKIKKFNF